MFSLPPFLGEELGSEAETSLMLTADMERLSSTEPGLAGVGRTSSGVTAGISTTGSSFFFLGDFKLNLFFGFFSFSTTSPLTGAIVLLDGVGL